MWRLLMPGCAFDRLNAPDLPAAAVIAQEPFGDRDVFRLRCGPAGQREHQQAVLRSQQRIGASRFDFFNIGAEILVVGDGQTAAKLADRADAVEPVIAREARAAVKGEQAEQRPRLGGATRLGSAEEVAGFAAGQRARHSADAGAEVADQIHGSARSRGSSEDWRGASVASRQWAGRRAARSFVTAMCQLARVGFSEVDQNRGERPPSCRPVPTSSRKPVLPVLRPWRRLPPLQGALSGRRRRGFRGSSSSIGLLSSLLFLLFADGRFDNADLGQAQHAASGGPTLFGLKLGNAFVALQHIARSGQASLAPQAFVNRHVRISSRWTAVARGGTLVSGAPFWPTKKHFSGRASQNNVSDCSSGFQLSERTAPIGLEPRQRPTPCSTECPWDTLILEKYRRIARICGLEHASDAVASPTLKTVADT